MQRDITAAVPGNHPLMLAWDAHKQTEEYANAKKCAAHPQRVDGSLWALFDAGWRTARLTQPEQAVDVESLAQEIRRVDGNHSLGAGALAEALMPFITAYLSENSRG